MAAPTAAPSISVTASAGNVPVEMDKVAKALDAIDSTPLDKLRETSEASLNITNKAVETTVDKLAALKRELANTGGVNNRLFKSVEKEVARFQNLDIDPKIKEQLASTFEQVRVGSLTPAQRAAEAGRNAPAVSKEVAEAKVRDERIAKERVAIDARANRVVAALKDRDDERVRRVQEDADLIAERRRSAEAKRGVQSVAAERDRISRAGGGGPGGSGPRGGTGAGGGGGSNDPLRSGVGAFDALTGGKKFDFGKGLQFGIAGVVASFVSDTLAGATKGAVEGRNNGEGAFVGALKTLPIVDGIAKTVSNTYDLYVDIGRITQSNAEIADRERQTTNAINASLIQRNKLIEDSQRGIADTQQGFAASLRGGRDGNVAGIRAEADAQLRALSQQRRDAARAATAEADQTIAPLQAQLVEKRATVGGDDTARQIRSAQILDIETQIARVRANERGQIAESNAALDEQDAVLRDIAGTRTRIAAGTANDTKGIEDQVFSLQNAIDTLSGDPIEQLRKEFEKLDPAGTAIGDFEKQLEAYRKKLDQVEVERRKFDATNAAKSILNFGDDNLRLAGLDGIARTLQELTNNGVDQSTVIAVRVQLEKESAAELKTQVEQTVRDIDAKVNVTLARDPRSRIDAEIAADDQKRRNSGQEARTPQEVTAERDARLKDFYASAAAQTREAAKTPQMKLAEATDSLREQFSRGFLSEDEARKGLGKGLNDYADAIRTSRPDLMEAGSAATEQFLAVASGQVVDATKPEIQLAKDANALLQRIADSLGRTSTKVSLAA